MLVKIRVDAYDKDSFSYFLKRVKFFERMDVIDRMLQTNQILLYTAKTFDELNLPPHPDTYVPTAVDFAVLPIPKRTWNIAELRAYVRTGNYAARGRRRHNAIPTVGISKIAAQLVVRELLGFMERTGKGTYAFTRAQLYHELTGFINLPKLEWDLPELIDYIAKITERARDVAEMIVTQLMPHLDRTTRATYRIRDFDIKTGYGLQAEIYPIRAALGIFVSMSGKPKYNIMNKIEIFNAIPAEWDSEREYKFMYELLNAAIMEWSNDDYDLPAMLGESNPEKRWHVPESTSDISGIVNAFDTEFNGTFRYRAMANADPEYPNFFSTTYGAKIVVDSLFKTFQKESERLRWLFSEHEPAIYKNILEKYGIVKFYDGERMRDIRKLTEAK